MGFLSNPLEILKIPKIPHFFRDFELFQDFFRFRKKAFFFETKFLNPKFVQEPENHT